jgi:anhydro-N-acetylmuramic acid kinase
MHTRWIIGLASGSTLDGVDAALVETEGVGLDLRLRGLHTLQMAYPRDLRELLARAAAQNQASLKHLGLAHRLLGETFAAAARQVADQASFSLQRAQCLGCPGHTLWHDFDGRFPATLELGMAAVIAERTGLTTVSDFRSRDVIAGGLGAPLTALIDWLFFRHPGEDRILVHLGGMATVVSLPAGEQLRQVLGFQAGPCNAFLDTLMLQLSGGRERFDPGGKHAVQGCCIEPLLRRWLAHPAFQRRPPKCFSLHSFGVEFVQHVLQQARQSHLGLHDLLCTATHLVAHGITDAIRRFLPRPPARVLLSGGGVKNGLLWHLLQQQFGDIPLERIDQHGVPALSRKAVAYAGLAALTVDGVPASLGTVTGAVGTRLLGSLTPGSSSNWARCLAWMAQQTAPLRAMQPELIEERV